MVLKGKTILITGGASGIGLEAAKGLLAEGMNVIICGRNQTKLDQAKKQLPTLTTIPCDITNADELTQLLATVKHLGGIDVLYNNAAVIYLYNLLASAEVTVEHATQEIMTNYLALVRLNGLLLPQLQQRNEAAIINTTSVVAYLPATVLPTYSASKAAVHSYTISLRYQLRNSPVKVFELMPPGVDTEAAKDLEADKIAPETVVKALIQGLKNDTPEIRVAIGKMFYYVQRFLPGVAFSILNPTKKA